MTTQGQPGGADKSAGKEDRWREEDRDAEDWAANDSFKRLSREEAAALRAKEPPVSPWRVIVVQATVGVVAALLGWLFTGRSEVAWSMLYGAAAVVVPGALMARGMTSRLSSAAPSLSAVSVLLWESVKIVFSVAMLVVANRVVQPLVWPALLLALVLCIKVYAVALLWRGRGRVELSETKKHGS
ncbi:MAG TPA: ATP synthase subunit I [Ramlibacter sp.]|nr:ATP synthase subunit I [Ramlibacter sp.]